MKALLSYWHGLGDLIILTPCLRALHEKGFQVTLMARNEALTSHLFDDCPYLEDIIVVANPWDAQEYKEAINVNAQALKKNGKHFDWLGCATHMSNPNRHKARMTAWELGVDIKDQEHFEVFINDDIKKEVAEYVEKNYPNGFIHMHTRPECHQEHMWPEAEEWVKETFPPLPIVDTGYEGSHYMIWENINYTFELAKHAKHRVYSSSVMVHAAEANDLVMDCINYGKEDRKVWPPNQDLVVRIREQGQWLRNPRLALEQVLEKQLGAFDVRHKRVLKEVQKHDKILEIGPGEGKSAMYLCNQTKSVSIVDAFPQKQLDLMNLCKEKKLFEPVQYDENKEFEENEFECVFACQVLEHIEAWKDVLILMMSWASKKVIMTVPVGRSFYSPDHVYFFGEKDFDFITKPHKLEKIITKEEDKQTGQRCWYLEIDCG